MRPFSLPTTITVTAENLTETVFQGYWGVRVNSPSGLGSYQALTQPGSFLNLLFPNLPAGNVPIPTGQAWNAYVADVDGDGKQELLFRNGSLPVSAAGVIGPPVPAGVRMRKFDSLAGGAKLTSLLGSDKLPGSIRYEMADVNGDGLLDAIEIPINGGGIRVAINDGLDFLPPVAVSSGTAGVVDGIVTIAQPVAVGQSVNGSAGQDVIDPGIRVMDYDLDGRADILLLGDGCVKGTSQLAQPSVYVSEISGTHFVSPQTLPTDGGSLSVFGESVFTPSAGGNCNRSFVKSQVLDVNGDGLSDFSQIENGSLVYYVHDGARPNLLTHVADGLGHTADVTYAPIGASGGAFIRTGSCSFPQYCDKSGIDVVSRHELDKGTSVDLAFSHQYDTARTDVTGVGFVGMDKHVVRDLQTGAVTTTSYDHLTRINAVYTGHDRPFSRQTIIPLATQQTLTRTWTNEYVAFVGSVLAVTPLSVAYQETESEPAGGGTAIKKSWNLGTQYDSKDGFLLSQFLVMGAESRFATYTRFPDQTDVWLVGLLQRETTTETTPANAATGAPSETVVRTVQYGRDLTTGALTSRTLEPDSTDPTLHLVTTYQLNAAGQVQATVEQSLDGITRTSTVDYDPISGVYPYRLQNALGQVKYEIIDPGLGVQAQLIDVNGLVTAWTHDGFGRIVATQRADEIPSTIAFRADGAHGFPFVTDTANQGGLVTVDFDLRDEPVLMVKRDDTGAFNQIKIAYDPYGRIVQKWRPYPQSQSGQEASLPQSVYGYDNAGRIISEVLAPSSQSWSYLVNTTTHTVGTENGLVEDDTLQDQLDRVVQRTEKLAATPTLPAHSVTTTYGYGPFDVSRDVIDTNGNVTHMVYDTRGRRLSVMDPDTGLGKDAHDAFDQLSSSTDASGRTQTYERDLLGRVETEETSEGANVFVWDTAANGIGQLASTSSLDGTNVTYEYNARRRRSAETLAVSGGSFRMDYTYDNFGRSFTVKYPVVGGTRYEVQFNYTPLSGELMSIQDPAQNVLWQVNQRNPDRNIVQETSGDGFVTVQGYEPQRGLLTSRTLGATASNASSPVDTLGFHYDERGYLDHRTDAQTGEPATDEHFMYDALGRLQTWSSATWSVGYAYDDIGNMRSRTLSSSTAQQTTTFMPGVLAGPHTLVAAVTGGVTQPYLYDLAGRRVSGPSGALEYTDFDLPRSVVSGTSRWNFQYDAAHRRAVKQTPSGTTTYVAGLYEHRATPSSVLDVMYVPGEARIVAQVTDTNGGSPSVQYFHPDHIQSIDAVTHLQTGADFLTPMKFDPFGTRTLPSSLASSPASTSEPIASVTRGFTGQEHDDDLGFINMNGRIYDPSVARFLTPDPHVTRPLKSQSWNRYSYAENSPLRFVDPTGFDDDDGPRGGMPDLTFRMPAPPSPHSGTPPPTGSFRDPITSPGQGIPPPPPPPQEDTPPATTPTTPPPPPPVSPPSTPSGPKGGGPGPNSTDDSGHQSHGRGEGPPPGATRPGVPNGTPGAGPVGLAPTGAPPGEAPGATPGGSEEHESGSVKVAEQVKQGAEATESLVDEFSLTTESLGKTLGDEILASASEWADRIGLVLGLGAGGIEFAIGASRGDAVGKTKGAIAIGVAIGAFIIDAPVIVGIAFGVVVGKAVPAILNQF